MIITFILIAVCIGSAAGLTMVVVNAEAESAARSVFRSKGASGLYLGCLIPIVGLTMVGLWTAYAFQVSDWRFAAIVWVPYLSGLIGRFATKTSAVS